MVEIVYRLEPGLQWRNWSQCGNPRLWRVTSERLASVVEGVFVWKRTRL